MIAKQRVTTPSYILIDDGFDELEVIAFLHRFRHAGLWIKSISLYHSLVYSRQGVGLKADMCLADVTAPRDNCLFILPAGGRNGENLRRDARVKKLLVNLSARNGKIAVTNAQSDLANDINNQIMSPYQPEQNQTLDEFIKSLTDRLIYGAN